MGASTVQIARVRVVKIALTTVMVVVGMETEDNAAVQVPVNVERCTPAELKRQDEHQEDGQQAVHAAILPDSP